MGSHSMEHKVNRKRLRSSYFITIVSLTLILFVIGILGFIAFEVNNLTRFIKENASLTLILKESATNKEILSYKKELDKKIYTKKSTFIDKEWAAEDFAKEIGEDFTGILGFNPLPSVINLTLKAEYVNKDSIQNVRNNLMEGIVIDEIEGDIGIIGSVDSMVKMVNYIFIGVSVLLLLISVVLINNTIRLSIYSKRFLIRTMLLVGAKRSFVRRPYIINSIIQGVICAVLAMGLLTGAIYYGSTYVPQLMLAIDVEVLLPVFGFVLCIGVVVSMVSSYFSISKYIKMNTDSLYRA